MTTPNHEYAYYSHVGYRLRAARQAAGLSQEQLGERIGVTGKCVSQWESATHRMSLFAYEPLSAILGGFR